MKSLIAYRPGASISVMKRVSSRKFLLFVALGVLFTGTIFLSYLPQAHSLVSINPSDTPGSSGSATEFPSQEKVFYDQNYWWVFWGSIGGTNGVYYETSTNGQTWSTPVDFTNAENPTNGGPEFDATLVGNNLYYVVAPTSGGTTFWWGEVTLQNTGTVAYVENNIAHTLTAGTKGAAAFRASIMVDGNGYLTIAVATSNAAATIFYMSVYQCQSAAATCALGTSTWYTAQFQLATLSTNDLTTPSLLSVSSGGNQYDVLTYDDASSSGSAAGYGPFKIFIAQSTAGSLPLSAMVPASPTCSPASQFYNEYNYGATSIGNTVYIVDNYFGSGTYSFSCPVGGPSSAEDPISANSYLASLGVSGSTLVAVFPNGASVQSWTSANGGVTWTAGPNVAQNTESGAYGLANSNWVDVSPVAYTIGAQTFMGVDWIDSNTIRFATLSLTNFPVSVSIAMGEYQTPTQTAWYPLGSAGYGNPGSFQISYTQCTAVGCASTSAQSVCYGTASGLIGPTCTVATGSYGCPAGAASGCYLTIPNVESYTAVTVAKWSTGSNANEEWCMNMGSSGFNGACSATVIGSSDGIPSTVTVGVTPSNNYIQVVYYDLLNNPSKYTVTPAAPAPTSTPTMHIVTAPSSTDYVTNPATYNDNQAAASGSYWIAKNSTDFASASIAGTASDQWVANPANLAWTVTAANQINPNIVYYHQYLNKFSISSGTAANFDGTGSFVIYGTQYGQFKIAIATFLPSGTNVFSADLWTDAATSVYFSPSFVASNLRWQSCPANICVPASDMDANGTTTNVISTGVGVNPVGYSLTYFKQFPESLAYGVSDSSTIPVNPPPIAYTAFGVPKNSGLNSTSSTVWMDAGTTAAVTQTYAGGAGERWYTPTASWTINAMNAVTSPSIVWYHQFQQTLVYETSDGSAVRGAPGSVTITYYTLGVQKAHLLNLTANVVWLDATKQVSINAVIQGALSSEQWTVQPAASSWPSISVENQVSNPIIYNHQYQITFNVVAPGTGSIQANSAVVTPGTPTWEPAGLSSLSLTGTWVTGYSFGGWTDTGGISIITPGAPTTVATVTGTGTITSTFTLVTGLGFVEQNVALTGPSWSVTVVAPAAIPNPGASGCTLLFGTTYTCSSVAQDIIISTAPLGTYTYTVPTPQAWGPGMQYVYSGATPQPVTLSVASPTGSVTVPFAVEYQLTLASDPVNAGTVTANPVSSSGDAGWYYTGATPTLTESVTAPGAVFQDWTGFSCGASCGSPSAQITIGTSAMTVTANYKLPLTVSLSPTSDVEGVGTTTIVTVTAVGGTGDITLTNGALPSGVVVGYNPNGSPGLQASASPGAVSVMTITIAPNAVFGTYTWTVTATDSLGVQASAVFTLTVISPTVTTIGFTSSAYAITYGSQNALFFASGHWFVLYSDGTNLVYRSSSDASGTNWDVPSNEVVVDGVTQGYSFSVATSGGNVYLVLLSPSFTGGFYYVQGQVEVCSGVAVISWSALPTCPVPTTPAPLAKLNTAPGLTTAGSPNIFLDPYGSCASAPTHVCVWVTVPALDKNLMWHVEVTQFTNTWRIPSLLGTGDIQLNQVYTGPDSQVHSELYVMPDGVAATFAVGNTPEYPHITVFDHGDLTSTTYCLGGEYNLAIPNECPLPPAGWAGVQVYMQQQQGAVVPSSPGTDVIYFAGLATSGSGSADVVFYSFNYTASSPGTSSFSAAPTVLGITSIPENDVIDHSWHIALTFGGNELYLAYGVDDSLAFQVGTLSVDGSTPNYSVAWSSPIQVPGVAGLVDGVSITYSGSTIGLAWVQTGGPLGYTVKFCVI
ncbi:MAG: hypothetical protein ABSF83_09945 [Nitrososphaerales archaeon]